MEDPAQFVDPMEPLAREVHRAAADLNAAIGSAIGKGLQVEVDTMMVSRPAYPHDVPVLRVTVSRPYRFGVEVKS